MAEGFALSVSGCGSRAGRRGKLPIGFIDSMNNPERVLEVNMLEIIPEVEAQDSLIGGTGCEAYGFVISDDCEQCPLATCRYDEVRKPGEAFGGVADGEMALQSYLRTTHGLPDSQVVPPGFDLRVRNIVFAMALKTGMEAKTIRDRANKGYPGKEYDELRGLQDEIRAADKVRASVIRKLILREGVTKRTINRRLAKGHYHINSEGEVYVTTLGKRGAGL